MLYEKPSGPMHEVIRKSLDELKVHSNPFGCITLVSAAIAASTCEAVHAQMCRQAVEIDTMDLLPPTASRGSQQYPTAQPSPAFSAISVTAASSPSSCAALSPDRASANDLTNLGGRPPLVAGMVIGSTPRKGGGPLSGTVSPHPSAVTATGTVVGSVAGPSKANATTVSAVSGAATAAGEASAGSEKRLGGGGAPSSSAASDGDGSATKKKYTFNAIQLLRLLLVRGEAFSQTRQHDKALLDAKVAVILSRRRSVEAYFACGREERRLFHIGESVACFEAGVHLLRATKREVLHNLRPQLLQHGCSVEGSTVVRNIDSSDAAVDQDGGSGAAVLDKVGASFLYQTFYLPEAYVDSLGGTGANAVVSFDAGAGAGPSSSSNTSNSNGARSEEEDYWAQRGYRLEDVQRLGLTREEVDEKEARYFENYARQRQKMLRLQRSTAAQAAGGPLSMHLDVTLLSSRDPSAAAMGPGPAHGIDLTTSATQSEQDEDAEAGASAAAPSAAALPAATADAPDSADSAADASHRRPHARRRRGEDDDLSGETNGDAVFSLFPEVRTRRQPADGARSPSASSAGSSVRRTHSRRDAHSGGLSLFRHNSEAEILFALNNYGMVPSELSAWLQLYVESRALKWIKRKKTFPSSVFGTTLYLLDRKVASVRNSTAIIIENTLLQQLATGVHAGIGAANRSAASCKAFNRLEFVGCTAPDAQYCGNYYFPETIRRSQVGFALLQPKGWSGYSGCVCYALRVDSPSSTSGQQPSRPPEYVSIFFCIEAPLMGSVKYGVRCVTGVAPDALRRAFYEVNSQRGGIHGVIGASKEPGETDRGAAVIGSGGSENGSFVGGVRNAIRSRASSAAAWAAGGGGRATPVNGSVEASASLSLQWPQPETAAQRAARLAALKAVRMTPSSTWRPSQTLVLRTRTDAAASASTAPAQPSERRIKISVTNNANATVACGTGGAVPTTLSAGGNLIYFSISERLPVRIKSVELIPALEYAGPAVLKKMSALSRRYRELINNLPPPLFYAPSLAGAPAGGGGGGGAGVGGGSGSTPRQLAGAQLQQQQQLMLQQSQSPRRSPFTFYPDYCLYGDRVSSPWVVRDKDVVIFRLYFDNRVLDHEEFSVVCSNETGGATGAASGASGIRHAFTGAIGDSASNRAPNTSDLGSGSRPRSPDPQGGGADAAPTASVSASHNANHSASAESTATTSAGGGFLDFDTVTSVSPIGSSARGAARGGGAGTAGSGPGQSTSSNGSNGNVLFYISADAQSRNSAQFSFGDRRTPFFSLKESWVPFSSTAYLESSSPSGRTFAAVHNANNGAMLTLSLTSAPKSSGAAGAASAAGAAHGAASSGAAGQDGGPSSKHESSGTTGGGGGNGNPSSSTTVSEQEGVLYTVRKRIQGPTGTMTGAAVVSTGTLSSDSAPAAHAGTGTVMRGEPVGPTAGATASSASLPKTGSSAGLTSTGSVGTPLQGRVSKFPSPQSAPIVGTQVLSGSASTVAAGGLVGTSAVGASRPQRAAGASVAVGANGGLARAEHYTVWRSASHGNGGEIVAEIRVLGASFPLLKGLLVGEARLLPGADALLISALTFMVARL